MKRRPLKPIIAPIYDGLVLTSQQWDQLSALLSDYISLANQHIVQFDHARNVSASHSTSKWVSQAADLRDIIEGRD